MKDGETQVNLEGEMGIRLSIIITTTLIGILTSMLCNHVKNNHSEN